MTVTCKPSMDPLRVEQVDDDLSLCINPSESAVTPSVPKRHSQVRTWAPGRPSLRLGPPGSIRQRFGFPADQMIHRDAYRSIRFSNLTHASGPGTGT